jgi:hypothetical protein
MSVGVSLDELLTWNDQSANFWKTHLEANPALLELPCGIGGTENVQAFEELAKFRRFAKDA